MKRLLIACFTLAAALSSAACRNNSNATPGTDDLYALVTKGMSCNQGGSGTSAETQMVCHYSVGDGLQFSIVSVGAADAGIVFDKVSADGPYRAAMSVKHGCVIVEPRADKGAAGLPQLAFVSPRSGKVYHTWQECAAGS
jgi:hypothetical protein